MTSNIVNFAECDYKILRSTSWEKPLKIKSDKTASGAEKRRIGNTAMLPTFDVTFQFSDVTNYKKFMTWFEERTLSGFRYFYLPRIDDVYGKVFIYRFKSDSNLSASNTAGNVIQVSCVLEEVGEYKTGA